MPYQDLIRTNIGLDVLRAGRLTFGKPAIIAEFDTAIFSERAQTVAQRSELVALGFSTSSATYAAFEAMTIQSRRPVNVTIGRRAAPVAQVDNVEVAGTDDGDYTHTIDGVDYTYAATSATAANIRDGLIALIDVEDRFAAAIVDGTNYSVTAANPGDRFVSAVTNADTNLVLSYTTANSGIYEDLAAIRAYDSTFYAVMEAAHNSWDILEGARWAEGETTRGALYLAQSNEAGILTSATTDIASQLQDLSRVRTGLVYHASDTEFVDAAILGKILPTEPGSVNWAWSVLLGLTADELTSGEVTNIRAKNANWFEHMGQGGTFFDGKSAGGIYLDLVRGRDRLVDEINASVIDLLQTADKVPYTDEGIAQVDSTLESAAVRLSPGLVVRDSIVVSGPELSEISEANRSNRLLPQRTLTATITGAVNEVETDGTLSVSVSTAA